MSTAEDDEKRRLADSLGAIDSNLDTMTTPIADDAQDVQNSHDHMWEARRDMDHIDKAAMRQSSDQKMRWSDVSRAQHIKMQKLRKSRYFGRFDFLRKDAEGSTAYYVGVHDFRDDDIGEAWVHGLAHARLGAVLRFRDRAGALRRPPRAGSAAT